MSLWEKTQRLQGDALDQLRNVYTQCFPIEVRHYCAQWIEEQPWEGVDTYNNQHEKMATGLLKNLLKEVENKAKHVSPTDFVTKMKLEEAMAYLREHYGRSPLNFVQITRNMLETEKHLVELAEHPGNITDASAPSTKTGPNGPLMQQFELLQRATKTTDSDLNILQHEQESFVILYQEKYQIEEALARQAGTPSEPRLRQRKEQVDQNLSQKANSILEKRMHLAKKHLDSIQNLEKVQNVVLNEHLMSWRRNQQLSGNGVPFFNNLDQIQQWCEMLGDVILQNRQQLQRVESLRTQLPIPMEPQQDLLPSLNAKITALLSSLVTSTFIVERQPPQVMKVSNKFSCSVRLLVGNKLNVHLTPPKVAGTIISEAQANALIKGDKSAITNSAGVIVNNNGLMEYNQAAKQLVVNFRNMALKTVKRSERKKHQEAVTEEKFCLLFQSKFNVANEMTFQVWTLSLPVVVIVHGSQEAQATAVIMWDNAFAELGRVPFEVPKEVLWKALAEQLNFKFKSQIGTGLCEEHLRFLAAKLLGRKEDTMEDLSNVKVSRAKFHKENLIERKFTFWEWFYDAMKLVKDHLQDLWNNGCIHGFLAKQTAQDWLLQKAPGTFLLRFSDSILGGVTIAWIRQDSESEIREVLSIQPYTSKDFQIRSCANRIRDLAVNLEFLYPDIPRDQAFSKYYTATEPQKLTGPNDYVASDLHTTIPIFGAGGGSGRSRSVTPFSIQSPHSPGESVQDPRSVMSQHSEMNAAANDMDFTDTNSPENMERWLNDESLHESLSSFEPPTDAAISQNELYNILYPGPNPGAYNLPSH
ncbi:Signal transducer and activator of transcription 5B [Hypsibius exemplaris]|uniref:Signal transducer and activator of transcription n=1 Tax=Hypsibius exemplaris TaxID=2072580 RepID=A0A1W0XEK1_HYPEX|nr:Signal transducer and activator of transcription 5B [Hypsibius exemplaris]